MNSSLNHWSWVGRYVFFSMIGFELNAQGLFQFSETKPMQLGGSSIVTTRLNYQDLLRCLALDTLIRIEMIMRCLKTSHQNLFIPPLSFETSKLKSVFCHGQILSHSLDFMILLFVNSLPISFNSARTINCSD